MPKLILATNNNHKISEISQFLNGENIEILSAKDFENFPEMEEIGETLDENAIIKARGVWDKFHLPCLADDTGLEVDYLRGAPGVYSARFAGENCSFDDNNRKLLNMLDGIPAELRSARFRTVMAFVDHEGRTHTEQGVLEGFIAEQPLGEYGFGYDPIFIVGGSNKTLAQFPLDEKNNISHRGRALKGIIPRIIKSLA
jgi:XTP/dITP diphosphohydrolase